MRRRRQIPLVALGLCLFATSASAQSHSTEPHDATATVSANANASTHEATLEAHPHGHRAHEATGARADRHARHERPHPSSLSMGFANSGRLENAERIQEDETLRYMPGRMLHYGTEELIGLIHRAARTVYRRHHVRLSVGDMSASHGGPVGHHVSHQSGRDVDLGFFIANRRGDPVLTDDYIEFTGDGTPRVGGSLHFDTARNWALVEALLEDPAVHVEHIFVSRPLRALLLSYARAHGESGSLIARAENVLHQPLTGSPHANHFHVRIGCPGNDTQCIEGVRLPPRPRRQRRVAQPERHHPHHGERASRD